MVSEAELTIPNQLQILDNNPVSPTTGTVSQVSIPGATLQHDAHKTSALSSPPTSDSPVNTPNSTSVNLPHECPKINEETSKCESKQLKLSHIALEVTRTKEEEEDNHSAESDTRISGDSTTASNINDKEKNKIKWTWSKIIYVVLALMSFALITYAIISIVMVTSSKGKRYFKSGTSASESDFIPWVPPFKVKLMQPDQKPNKLPEPEEGFKLSPFWNFERNPFMCDPSYPGALNAGDKKWCDNLFRDVNITPFDNLDNFKKKVKIPVLNTNNRKIQDYRSHYTTLRDLKVYEAKPYLWWFDKLQSRHCTDKLIPGVSFAHKYRDWEEWNQDIESEIRKFVHKHFESSNAKSLIIKPGHTHRSYGVMSVMNKSEKISTDANPIFNFHYDETPIPEFYKNVEKKIQKEIRNAIIPAKSSKKEIIIMKNIKELSTTINSDKKARAILDYYSKNAYEKIEFNIDDEFYMTLDKREQDTQRKATPPSQISVSPSIIIEERIPKPLNLDISGFTALEIKCVFIFGEFQQCFTLIESGEYRGKFNRNFDCVYDGQQDEEEETFKTKCGNLLGLMDWHKIIPRLEELAYRMALDWVRIDIFYINENEFYINEYETRSGSEHTYNEYLFNALKKAWKTPKFYVKDKKMEQLNCSSKMNEALNQYIEKK